METQEIQLPSSEEQQAIRDAIQKLCSDYPN
jgi:hypothetical protein